MTDMHQDSIIEYSVDIATAEAPVPLPATIYNATIVEAVPKTSTNTGKRYAAVKVLIHPDDYPADYPSENAPEGTVLTYNLISLEDTPPARWRLRSFLEKIGAPASRRIDMGEWLHRQVKVVLKHEIFDGLQRATIDKFESID